MTEQQLDENGVLHPDFALVEQDLWRNIKQERDQLLQHSDWVVTRAYETKTEVPAEWLEYRQALRDITDQTDPMAIDWPKKPA